MKDAWKRLMYAKVAAEILRGSPEDALFRTVSSVIEVWGRWAGGDTLTFKWTDRFLQTIVG
jgi:hypothetical protein